MIVDNTDFYMVTMDYMSTKVPTTVVSFVDNGTFKVGTYFMYMVGLGYVSDVEFSLRINDDEIKTLNEYYLPDCYNTSDDGYYSITLGEYDMPINVQKKIAFYLSKGVPVYLGSTYKILDFEYDDGEYYSSYKYMMTWVGNRRLIMGYITRNNKNNTTSYRQTYYDDRGIESVSSTEEENYYFMLNDDFVPVIYKTQQDQFNKPGEFLYRGNTLRSPSGKIYQLKVDDNGNLSVVHEGYA